MASLIDTTKSRILFDHDIGEAAEIERNVKNILATPKGTMPGSRAFGLDHSAVDYPAVIAQNMIAVGLADELAEYEPRAELSEVQIVAAPDGTALYPVITLTKGDEE